jgi:hypothetical protein
MKNKSDARNKDASRKQTAGSGPSQGKKFSPKQDRPQAGTKRTTNAASPKFSSEEPAPRPKRQDGPKPRPATGSVNFPRSSSKFGAKPAQAKGAPAASTPEPRKAAQPKPQQHERVVD